MYSLDLWVIERSCGAQVVAQQKIERLLAEVLDLGDLNEEGGGRAGDVELAEGAWLGGWPSRPATAMRRPVG